MREHRFIRSSLPGFERGLFHNGTRRAAPASIRDRPVCEKMNSLIKTVDRADLTFAQTARMGLLSLFLSPCFLAAAWLAGGKGLGVHLFSLRKGLRLVAKKPSKLYAKWIYYPLDSTRYVEIDFVQRHAGKFQTWLDLSSPRLIAALLLSRNRQASSTLLNPDAADMAETREMAALLGLNCKTINATLDAVDPGALRFDHLCFGPGAHSG